MDAEIRWTHNDSVQDIRFHTRHFIQYKIIYNSNYQLHPITHIAGTDSPIIRTVQINAVNIKPFSTLDSPREEVLSHSMRLTLKASDERIL